MSAPSHRAVLQKRFPMILSVSRRTDIPAFYSEWFLNRLVEGFVLVRNPMNPRQMRRVRLSPDVIDCIVFWSKNPRPMLELLSKSDALPNACPIPDRLSKIGRYPFYFQFTMNAYGAGLEPGLPPLEERIRTFRELSERIGAERVIWRYDPILLTEQYDVRFHLEQFERIAEELQGYTERCAISFVDVYRKLRSSFSRLGITECEPEQVLELAEGFSGICREREFELSTCAEKADLSALGIGHARCIDAELISRIIGRELKVSKDKNQRLECGCAESVDIGAYNTCPHGCVYCYANHNAALAARNFKAHDPKSTLLSGPYL